MAQMQSGISTYTLPTKITCTPKVGGSESNQALKAFLPFGFWANYKYLHKMTMQMVQLLEKNRKEDLCVF